MTTSNTFVSAVVPIRNCSTSGDFPRLWRLDGNNKSVTDAGLSHLKGMANLKDLDLGSANVTDAGLATVSGLGNLKFLTLYNTRITGTGLAHLKNLGTLECLSLDTTQVADDGWPPQGTTKSPRAFP